MSNAFTEEKESLLLLQADCLYYVSAVLISGVPLYLIVSSRTSVKVKYVDDILQA